MAQRTTYWSNSKFADFIRGVKKPGAETSQGWNKWQKATKEKNPVRYWIVEEGFDKVQGALYWPTDQLYNFKYYFNNRFISKTHTLTSSSLKRGQWQEFGTRVLHCNFDELVNFVEIEQAWSHIRWSDKTERRKYNTPWYASGWFRWRTWRSPAAGLDQLYWAAGLVFDEDMGVHPGMTGYGKPTQQAEDAKETLALYHWWKNVRPNRPDEHEVSGWTAICNRRAEKNDGTIFGEDDTQEEMIESRAALDRCREIEEAYEKEDEEMLVRLVKHSRRLWT